MRWIRDERTTTDGPDAAAVEISLFRIPAGLPLDALDEFGPDDLDAEELARARELRSDDARARFVERRTRLRDAMARETGRRHRDVTYWREPCAGCGDPHGRPRAVGWPGYFSSTSTRGLGALAVATRPVGIDVERLVSGETATDVVALLHPRERDVVMRAAQLGDLAGRRAFTRIWVRKEALLKATGEGLTAPLDRDDLSDPESHPVTGWRVVDLAEETMTGWGADDVFGAFAVAATPSPSATPSGRPRHGRQPPPGVTSRT